MTHELDHAHASAHAPSATADHDGPTPGRSSKSALMRKPDHAVPSGLLSRKARDANGVAEGAESAVAAASSSSGSPLPDTLMRKFESSLGADLSGVRVHTGAESAAANDAVGARAYTVGNDIHFGAGQYDPESQGGQHLIAHEVAHTVQQAGGASRMQFKLEVSSSGDAHEREADRAADSMVAGTPASVGSSTGLDRSVIHRKEGESPVVLKGIDIPIVEVSAPEVELGPFKGKTKLGGKVSLKPGGPPGAGGAKKDDKKDEQKGEKKDAGHPVEVKVGADKDKVKIAAEKEFGGEKWGIKPKMFGEAELDKNGHPKANIGLGLEHEGYKLTNKQVGPFAANFKAFEWEHGGKPKIATLELEVGASAQTEQQFYGHQVSVALKGTVEIEPNWVEIGKWIGQQVGPMIASGAATSAALIAAPFVTFGVMLAGWARAGHEFDEVQARIKSHRARCQMAAEEALTGKHVAVTLFGMDVNAGSTDLANKVRSTLSEAFGIPAGAFPEAVKAKPALVPLIYRTAWAHSWPALKAQLLANYQDTTFKSYKFERMWLDSFDSGEYSKG
ncbi:MAG: DUF4157 domain-containing protein [Myxococcales bacterium]|nr:DUF4157 domain-containing protein [Myxococcales bacterium]